MKKILQNERRASKNVKTQTHMIITTDKDSVELAKHVHTTEEAFALEGEILSVATGELT